MDRPVAEERRNQVVSLPDGRRVGFAEYGDPNGRPVLYCHGSPGSRLELSLVEDVDGVLVERGVRLVAPDRPGFGRSDPLRGRQFTDWPADASTLLEALGCDRVSVLSYSAGSPYALACAVAWPGRVDAVGIVSGVGRPFLEPGARDGMGATRMYWGAARLHPRPAAAILWLQARAPRGRLPSQGRVGVPDPDWEVMGNVGFWSALIEATFVEACRQSARWPAEEAVLYLRPWRFDPAEASMPVHVWHGGLDRNAPISHAEHLIERIPDARAHLSSSDGHVSILARRFPEIVATLTSIGGDSG